MPRVSRNKMMRIISIPERAMELWRQGYTTKRVLSILKEEFPEYERRTLENYIYESQRTENIKKRFLEDN